MVVERLSHGDSEDEHGDQRKRDKQTP